MAERKWTPEQQNAISSRGGTVLVSAAAGSGKTAVLVERVVGRIVDKAQPIDLDRLLVVTFSNAAAMEMKQRISAKLTSMLQQDPGNMQLHRQQLLLSKANISTIHSFCLNIVKNHFQLLEITPDFKIADQKELEIIRSNCADDTLEAFYTDQQENGFDQLVELLTTGRDDKKVIETMLKLYDFVRSHPFYDQWLKMKLGFYDKEIDISQSIWGRAIFNYAQDAVKHALRLNEQALQLISEDSRVEKAYLLAYSSDKILLNDLLIEIKRSDWDMICHKLKIFTFEKLGVLRNFEDTALKDTIQGYRKKIKKIIEDLKTKQFCSTSQEFYDDMIYLYPKVKLLFCMVLEFDRRFSLEKANKKLMDFSDLEHFALKLLVNNQSGFSKTPLAEQLSLQFDEIYIDEYQDTNEAQDMIFQFISKDEQNLFMVGDVKQSIYRFRQAMPELFLEKRTKFYSYDSTHYPATITLGKNFRSHKEITDCINFFFRQIMSKKLGEIDYDEKEQLIAESKDTAQIAGVDFYALDRSNYVGEDSNITIEARFVAEKIAEIIESGQLIYEGDTLRKIRPGDIAILMRSPKTKAPIYLKELTSIGINSYAEQQEGFFTTKEISWMISLLRIVNNPLLDVELVAVLMSPMFGFSSDEITQIRLGDRYCSFYNALIKSSNSNQKITDFLQLLDQIRRYSISLSASQLIQKIYDSIDFESIVRVMRFGETRGANLRLLIDYAQNYHSYGYKGLGGFIRFIDRLIERGGDLSPSSIVPEQLDVVRIMSIHRSKGLEFPIVFLVDSAKQFNREDLRNNTLIHSQMGFACVRRDFKVMKQFTTVPMQAVKLELENQMLSEEMRVLYVALTRAKQRLIITGVVNNIESKLQKLNIPLQNNTISPYAVREGESYFDWILICLLHHRDGTELIKNYSLETQGIVPCDSTIHARIIAVDTIQTIQQNEQGRGDAIPYNDAMLIEVKNRIDFKYPHEQLTQIPTKLAVSQISKSSLIKEYRFNTRPSFLYEKGFTNAEKGNLLHRFMQFAIYENAAIDVKKELQRLLLAGYFLKEEIAVLSIKKLQNFFNSVLAKRILSSQKVYRELRFLAEVDETIINQYTDLYQGSYKTAIQGVADCVFIENGTAIIVDYKSDLVTDGTELINRYQFQLQLYKEVLKESLETTISQCIIYSFSLDKEIII